MRLCRPNAAACRAAIRRFKSGPWLVTFVTRSHYKVDSFREKPTHGSWGVGHDGPLTALWRACHAHSPRARSSRSGSMSRVASTTTLTAIRFSSSSSVPRLRRSPDTGRDRRSSIGTSGKESRRSGSGRRSSRSNVRTAGTRPRITRTVTASTTRRRRSSGRRVSSGSNRPRCSTCPKPRVSRCLTSTRKPLVSRPHRTRTRRATRPHRGDHRTA